MNTAPGGESLPCPSTRSRLPKYGWMFEMPQQGTDKAQLTMTTAEFMHDAAMRLAGTRMTSMVDQDGKVPESGKGPMDVLGSPILFAVAIELALNCVWMEERKKKGRAGRQTKSTAAARHDLSVLFRRLSKHNKEAISEEVAKRGWRVEPVLDFHKAMVMDWRYPVDRMAADGALFWWGKEPLSATFNGVLAAWRGRYPKLKTPPSREDAQTTQQQMLKKREEVNEKMKAARITS